MVQIAVDVHGSPRQRDHARAQLVLEVLQVRHQETLGVGADLVHDAVVLSEHEVQLVVVHLELVFLEQHYLG